MVVGAATASIEALIAGLVEARAGLHYRIAERELFAQRLADHALECGYDSLLEYYYHLRYDDPSGAALDQLVEALLVHETYFFREARALSAAIDHFVMPALAAGRRPRIWSAACSTGEEPLTIAMLLAERGLAGRCDLLASDLSERALARARAGRYRPRSLRGEGHDIAARWLELGHDAIVAPAALRAQIHFARVNLCAAGGFAALGRFDLIVCRHVLIYFDDPSIARVVEALGRSLRDGGALIVGVSESLLRFSTELRCEERDATFFYTRRS